jgi:hypothetical protein
MDNKEFLEKLKFGVGDGNLQYYIYNWKCPQMNPEKVYLINLIILNSNFLFSWHYYFNKKKSIETTTTKKNSFQLCDFF